MLLTGILPVVIFTLIEEYYGTEWGLIAGLIFGFVEIMWEYSREKKVSGVTWFGNGMLFVLGGVALLTKEGLWFKLQPAILELVFALFLWGSIIIKKPVMLLMLEKQKMQVPEILKTKINGMSFRIGLFLMAHAILATWAALYWSTQAWALLKGIGFTFSFILYMFLEAIFLRQQLKNQNDRETQNNQNSQNSQNNP
jgi:intracellular septation protein